LLEIHWSLDLGPSSKVALSKQASKQVRQAAEDSELIFCFVFFLSLQSIIRYQSTHSLLSPSSKRYLMLLLALTLNYEVFPLSACGLVFLSRVTLMRKKRKGQDTLKEEEEPEEERK
jgi:hypothetical protein